MKNKLIRTAGEQLRFFLQRGLFHIFGSSLLNNFILFFTNIFVVNLVSKDAYGVYTYANNIVSFFLLARGLGLISGMLQFASESRDRTVRGHVCKLSLLAGNLINLILALLIAVYALFGPVTIAGSRGYMIAMAFVPLTQWMFDFVTTCFRILRRNIAYARITNLNTVLYFLCSVIGCKLFGIFGLIASKYIAHIVCIGISMCAMRWDIREMMAVQLREYREAKSLFRYSLAACASNSLSELLYLLDVFLIGIVIASPGVIASYKVATQIPTALTMIPTTIVMFIYPYFAEHRGQRAWMIQQTKRVMLALAAVNLLIGLSLFFAAPLVIQLLWGDKYADALPVLRILSINYIISGTFRIPCGNILAMMRKINANLLVSVVSGVCNIILDIILIQYWASVGAALATVAVVILSSVISTVWMVQSIRKLPAQQT